jgi:hypothetical protein
MKSINIILIDFIISTMLIAQTNHVPTISADFPDAVITKQGISVKDSIFALPLVDFGFDLDGDSLTWSTSTEDSVMAFFNANQETLYVHGKENWYGRGKFIVRLEDNSGALDEKEIDVVCIKKDGTLLSNDGTKTEYYIPWHPLLDFNRIASVEQFLTEEGYSEEALERKINWSKWKQLKFMKGVTFDGDWLSDLGAWSYDATKLRIDFMLDELRRDHVDWIFWRSIYFAEDVSSSEIIQLFDYEGINNGTVKLSTPDKGLRYLINQAHNKGFKIATGPFIADIQFGRSDLNPQDWDLWFQNYSNILSHVSNIGQETGLDLLVVGESLVAVSFIGSTISNFNWTTKFTESIQKNRLIYFGPITYLDALIDRVDDNYYVEDWKKYYQVFGEIDIISSGVFFKGLIQKPNPSVSEIKTSFDNYNQHIIHHLNQIFHKPVIFYENGIPSMKNVVYRMFESIAGTYRTREVDLNEQKNWYEAIFLTMQDKEYFFGFNWYGISLINLGGYNSNQLTFRNKPAEEIVRFYYGNGDTTKPVITIDGKFNDWDQKYNIAHDSDDDCKVDYVDLVNVFGIIDSMYLHIFLEMHGGLRQTNAINYYLNFENDTSSELAGNIFFDEYDGWVALLHKDNNFDELLGILDTNSDSNFSKIEFRIPLRLINYKKDISINLEIIDPGHSNIIVDNLDGFYTIPLFQNLTDIGGIKGNINSIPFRLSQNYPNPFNLSTKINFQITKIGLVKVFVFDILGRKVRTLLEKEMQTGQHSISWNGKDENENDVSSGLYFFRMESGDLVYVKKGLLLK